MQQQHKNCNSKHKSAQQFWGFDLDQLGKNIEEFFNNSNVNEFFGSDGIQKSPAVNVFEYDTHLEIEIAAPGLEKSDFSVSIENDVLTISSNATVKERGENVKVKRNEFNFSTFKRQFRLTDIFDNQNITAKYQQGILKVTIAKKTAEQKGSIKIEIL